MSVLLKAGGAIDICTTRVGLDGGGSSWSLVEGGVSIHQRSSRLRRTFHPKAVITCFPMHTPRLGAPSLDLSSRFVRPIMAHGGNEEHHALPLSAMAMEVSPVVLRDFGLCFS